MRVNKMEELREYAIKVLNNKLSYFNDKSNFDAVFTADNYYIMCCSYALAYNEIGIFNYAEINMWQDKFAHAWYRVKHDI